MPCKPILFSIDPSSRITGVAVFVGDTLIDWSLLKVTANREPVDRCLAMCAAVETVLDGIIAKLDGVDRTVTVVIEIPGGQNRPHSRGLVTLGMSVGMIIAYLTALGYRVVTVKASEWTRLGGGRCLSKAVRAEHIQEMYPDSYAPEKDKGMDGADAIGLGSWYLGFFNKED